MLPILMLVGCVVLRLIPHPPNFAPVGATSVFAGRTMRLGTGLVLTLSTMLDILPETPRPRSRMSVNVAAVSEDEPRLQLRR